MHIRFEAEPDKKQLTRAMRHVLRGPRRHLRVIGSLLLVLAAPLALVRAWQVALPAAVLGIVYLWVLPAFTVWRSVKMSWRLCGLPTAYEFTEEGVRSRNDLADSMIRWPALTGVDQLPGQIVFRLSKRQFFTVPTATMSGGDEQELLTFLRGRGLLGPVQPDDPNRVPPPSVWAEKTAAERDGTIRPPVP